MRGDDLLRARALLTLALGGERDIATGYHVSLADHRFRMRSLLRGGAHEAVKEAALLTDDDAEPRLRPGEQVNVYWENEGGVVPGEYRGRILSVDGDVIRARFESRGSRDKEDIFIDVRALRDLTNDAALRYVEMVEEPMLDD